MGAARRLSSRSITSCLRVLAALLVLSLAACSHDLDALRSGSAAGGTGGAGAGGAGQSGDGGDGGESAGAGGEGEDPELASCAPCAAPAVQAAALGFEACCRGLRGIECGLRLGEGLCLPRDLAGEVSEACPAVTAPNEQSFDGCCRPDARCGVDLGPLGLGCVPREELPTVVGDGLERIGCGIACEQDGDCPTLAGEGAVCVPERDNRAVRFCAAQCSRDRDCPSGQLCGLANDIDRDRLVSYCQTAIGAVEPGAACEAADDCQRGVCIRLQAGSDGVCSRLCEGDPDCSGTLANCVSSNIPRPESGDPQSFDVCSE